MKGEPRRFCEGHGIREAHRVARERAAARRLVRVVLWRPPALRRRRWQYARRIGPLALCRCGCGLPETSVGSGWASRHRGRRAYVVDENGCWIWQLSIASHGYPRLRVGGEHRRAHRLFFERRYGPVPDDHDVHHECGVRACVNPDHLRALPRDEHNAIHHPAVA